MQTIKTPRPWKKLISLFAVAATLAGGASSQKYNARLNGELGKTSQQLISAFGQPSKVRKLANGDEIISYVSINYQVIPDPNYYFNTGFMTENELFDPFTYGDDEIPVGDFMGETITDFCKTDFYLTNNVVTSWQWRGNACDAL